MGEGHWVGNCAAEGRTGASRVELGRVELLGSWGSSKGWGAGLVDELLCWAGQGIVWPPPMQPQLLILFVN